MARVLFVSKAVEPPWNDSSKNLVHDLSSHLTRHQGVVMSDRSGPGKLKIYGQRDAAFAPALLSNLRVLGGLVTSRGTDLWHYFFAPNPRTSTVSRWVNRARLKPTVHTVCSAPKAFVPSVLFADKTVVLSKQTEEGFLSAGVSSDRLTRIAPCIPTLKTTMSKAQARAHFGLPPDGKVALFAGDLEFGGGAPRSLKLLDVDPELHLVMACRAKTPAAAKVEATLRRGLSASQGSRVTWVGETGHIHELLACVDVMVFPVTDLYAKMDYPLVLLEAMQLGTPVVAAYGTPAAELQTHGATIVSADEVAESSVALLRDDHKAKELAGRAAKSVQEHFSPVSMVQKYEALYDELV